MSGHCFSSNNLRVTVVGEDLNCRVTKSKLKAIVTVKPHLANQYRPWATSFLYMTQTQHFYKTERFSFSYNNKRK